MKFLLWVMGELWRAHRAKRWAWPRKCRWCDGTVAYLGGADAVQHSVPVCETWAALSGAIGRGDGR